MRLRLRTTAEHAGQRLDVALAEWLPRALGRPLTKSALRRLVMAGAIQVEGRPLRAPGRVLRAGVEIVARIDTDRVADAPSRERFVLTPSAILHEDDAIIAVDKPAGLPTVPTADPRRPSLVRAVEAFLAQAGRGPSALGVHQRLDADTSGVVLFAKDARANPALSAAFAKKTILKVYDVLTQRPQTLPPSTWSTESALAARGRRGMATVRAGGLYARTDFALLEVFPKALLVEARPSTGRKHQIRVHLAEAGLPVLGDALYGPASRPSAGSARGAPRPERLMLHARRLALQHPLTGTPLVIESPWPEDFRRVIEAMRVSAPVRTRPR